MGHTGLVLRFLNRFLVTACVAVLSACGGGGGETPPPTPPHAVSLTIGGLPGTAMVPAQSAQLTATLTYSDTSTKDVTASAAWSTTDASVLSVSSAGAISAVATGQAEVVAAAEGLAARGAVTVAKPAPQPASLSIGGIPPGWMLPAQSAQLRATLTYSDGSTADVTAGTTWRSTSTNVFTVSSAGAIQSVAPGQAEVVASAQGLDSRGTVRVVRSTPRLALFAGNLGGAGNADGIGAEARFFNPRAVATDRFGNIYVADEHNYTIRKITPTGFVSTLAGKAGEIGSADGIGSEARFSYPSGIAVDSAGNVFVGDAVNSTVRKITPTGAVSTLAGKAGESGSTDGIAEAARFYYPRGIAVDNAGNVYVADELNHSIRKVTPTGVVTTVAGKAGSSGSTDGIGAEARFWGPLGVATDSVGNVYVADTMNQTIRKITTAGIVSTVAGTPGLTGSTDGTGAEARFLRPAGVAADGTGNVYVADAGNYTVRKITPAGVVSTLAGSAGSRGSTDGIGAEARFLGPACVAADNSGNVYVGDATIRKINASGFTSTLAGAVRVSGTTDGIGADARFSTPHGLATDGLGNLYVADFGNNTIRKATSTGVVSTLAGKAGVGGSTDGNATDALFYLAQGIAVDNAGNVYLADGYPNTVRKVSPAGVVSTLAGTPDYKGGSADGTGAEARFAFCKWIYVPPVPGSIHEHSYEVCFVAGLAIDEAGDIYAADSGNHSIRKITSAGVVTTVAGVPGSPGSTDGVAADARFLEPQGVATGRHGNIFVADTGNHTIRRIDSDGRVSTLAGAAGSSGTADGLGAQARFSKPQSVATDALGNVYVADTGNHTIRKIDPMGVVTTIAGVAGVSGFSPGTLPGVLASPQGIAVSGNSLYITLYNGVAVVTDVP